MATQTLPTPATQLLPQEQIIDVITYTAGLASSLEAIDPLLNVLRSITVTVPHGTSFSSQNLTALHALQQKLEDYLVHQEKVRTFDYNSLHQHIQQRFQAGHPLRPLNLALAGAFVLAFSLGGSIFLLPLNIAADAKPVVGLSVCYSTIYVSAAVFFLWARSKLTSEARSAYWYVFVSIVMMAVAILAQPTSVLLGLQQNPWVPILIAAPLVPAFIAFYIGVKKIARLTNVVDSRLLSVKLLLAAEAVAIAVSCILPPLVVPYTNNPFPVPHVILAMILENVNTVLLAISALILWQATRHLAYLYLRGIKALIFSTVMHGIVTVYFGVYWLVIGSLVTNPFLEFGLLIGTITLISYLRAGYIFNKIHRY